MFLYFNLECRNRVDLFSTPVSEFDRTLGPVYMKGGCPANRATLGGLLIRFFRKRIECLHATQSSPPTLGTLSTCPGHPLGGIAFYHVNVSCWDILASRGEINCENMAARGECFRS